MMDYLNPALFEDPEILKDIGVRLAAGELVVIQNAFLNDFAEYVWADLAREELEWPFNEYYAGNGFGYSHHNFYDSTRFSPVMKQTYSIFDHPATKTFMTELSQRDCLAEHPISASPSRYLPGDYSLSHTDQEDDRAVAFVWHLSKNWRGAWGGALYWESEDHENAYYPASFNTLHLFSVSIRSAHFVTAVSRIAVGKRLTFNGWWNSKYIPSAEDPLEIMYATPESRLTLTWRQCDAIFNLDLDGVDEERRVKLQSLRDALWAEHNPDYRSIAVVELEPSKQI